MRAGGPNLGSGALSLLAVMFALASEGFTAQAGGPVSTTSLLSREKQNALVNDYCSGCHSAKTKKGGLVLEDFDAASPFLGTDFLETLILKVRTGMMPPAGSARPDPEMLLAFVETLEARADASPSRAPSSLMRPLQRLNRAEYSRAVKDLLGVEVDAADFLPADTVSAGFDNIADVQTVSPALVTAWLRSASTVSRLAFSAGSAGENRSRRAGWKVSCSPRGRADEDRCARIALGDLIGRAYRGAGGPEDEAAAFAFYAKGRDAGGFREGLRLALQSILANPKFLLRVEGSETGATAGPTPASDRDLASRLSFFVWSSAPDASLLAAARRGRLRTREGLLSETQRLLADSRSEALATRFASQWLRLQDLEKASPDPKLYPRFNRDLARAMRRESELFVGRLFREDRSVLDLITSERSFVNGPLARLYGVEGVTGDDFREVSLPPERRGLLGQAAILTLTSLGDRTSPVLRGKWVMDVLLGVPPPPPPPNVPALDDTVKPTRNGAKLSTRDRVVEHRRNPGCAGCHRAIDPAGLVLEGFDAIGAARRDEGGAALDLSTELYDGRAIEGPAGLREALLVHRDQVLRNFAAQLLTYATGRRLVPRDMKTVRAIVKEAAMKGNRFSAFVAGVVTSDAFRSPSS
jgi:hypothetical protein